MGGGNFSAVLFVLKPLANRYDEYCDIPSIYVGADIIRLLNIIIHKKGRQKQNSAVRNS
jgi:hypothetical protein